MIADLELEAFSRRFVSRKSGVPLSVFAGVSFVGDFAQIVLAREGQFQAQLCLCKPNSEIPDHNHPNVDQLLVYETGQIDLRIDGRECFEPKDMGVTKEGTSKLNGHFRPIGPGVSHGATIGPAGGAFITIQRWLKGAPDSVENDWDGDPLSDEHAQRLEFA